VGEVAGACFCCNFNELTSTVEQLGSDQRPEIILAEPVGSCTDLVATVSASSATRAGGGSRPRPSTSSASSWKRPTFSSSTASTNCPPRR
jgi:hypothetical protein